MRRLVRAYRPAARPGLTQVDRYGSPSAASGRQNEHSSLLTAPARGGGKRRGRALAAALPAAVSDCVGPFA